MLFKETVTPDTLKLLKTIQSLDEFRQTRLVGGTALALQIGHRKSIDLDFFGKTDASFEDLTLRLSEVASVRAISSSRSMRFFVINGVKVDVVNYPYDWISDPVEEDGICLAGLKDIAAMKLSAITNRGTKKDFIDFYFLLQMFSIDELLNFYVQKYTSDSLFTVTKSITYFEDAENEPLPVMLKDINWAEVKNYIRKIVSGSFV